MGDIIDGFIFYNELDLLEIRLYELEPVVDKFVLVEGTHTHQGSEKPLYFDEHKSWFSRYNIEHIVVPTLHPKKPTAQQVWENESFQRNQIALGMTDFPDDVGMVSDVDEIPSRGLIASLNRIKLPIKVKQRMSYYFMNMVSPTMVWHGTTIAPSSEVRRITPQKLRDCIFSPDMPSTPGGWHFSYLGTPEFIVDKLKNFTHSEYNKPEYTDPAKIKQLIGEGKDILGRGYTFEKIGKNEDFPRLVQEQPERFEKYFV